jgi:hypothetical protein
MLVVVPSHDYLFPVHFTFTRSYLNSFKLNWFTRSYLKIFPQKEANLVHMRCTSASGF